MSVEGEDHTCGENAAAFSRTGALSGRAIHVTEIPPRAATSTTGRRPLALPALGSLAHITRCHQGISIFTVGIKCPLNISLLKNL